MLFYTFNIFSVALLGLSFSAGETTLPVITCKRDLVDYSACLKHALEEAWPRFVKGLPEFDFPPLDPLIYKYGKAVFNSSDIFHAEVVLSNVTGRGLVKTRFNDVRAHFLDDVFRLEIDAEVSKLFLKGFMKMNGILGSTFRIADEGSFNMTLDDVRGTWDITGHVVNDTWIAEHFRMFPTVAKVKLYFKLSQTSKELNDLAIQFVNEFWPALYRVMLPTVSDAWDPWLIEYVNIFFSKVPFSKVFP